MTDSAKILIVEDEQIVAKDIQRTLQGLGYQVPGTVAAGDQAISQSEVHRPDLVLMDIRLRGSMDGIAAASVIRDRFDIPVVFLTAYADPATLERAKISEPFGYVLKPFEERDLHATIEMALYKHRLERKLRESERWLNVTLRSIGDGVIATDAEGQIVFLNPVAESLTGWTAEEAKGRKLGEVFRIVNEATGEKADDPVSQIITSGLTVGLANHTLLIARDGTRRPIDDSGAPIRAEGQPLQGVVLVFRDITDRRLAETELRDSERRFKTLASHAPVGIFQSDLQGNCLFVNDRWCEMAGLSPEEAYGQGWIQALHPEDHDHILQEWHTAMKGGYEFTAEYRYQTPDEKVTWLSGRAVPLADDRGGVSGYIGTVTDITHRKYAEESLQEVQKQLQIVTDAMSARVARYSRDLRYVWVSRYYAEWLEKPLEAIIGRPIRDVLGDQAFEQLLPHFERVLSGENVDIEDEVSIRGIGTRWINAVYTPTVSTPGEVDGWVGVIIDLTEHRKMENALVEADRRKDEFLATLSHELRNPLAPIKSSVAILNSIQSSDARLTTAREVIDRQVRHMARLLDDLLDVSRITLGKLGLRNERLQLAEIVETAVETTRPLVQSKEQKLYLSLPAEPIYLQADPVRLAQVLANLLNNAAKYTNKDGNIWLTAERRDNHVAISVKDDGIGISSEMLPRVFDTFSQVSPALERSEGGLGIGLSLVKGLVELQGGTVSARSDGLGRGSEFIVCLPISSIQKPAVEAPKVIAPRKRDADVTRRLLIVDDVKDSADSLAALLRIIGHDVTTAYDGEQAIRVAELVKPEVILLDLGMPKLNGYEVCRRIREQHWGKGAYLIALTGWGQHEDRLRTAQAGFNHHLVKPVDAAELDNMLALLPKRISDS